METTEDLKYYYGQARREVRGFRAVANDNLCIVHEDRLIAVEHTNDLLSEATEKLQEEVALLRRCLARAERENKCLLIRNTELHFLNEKLQSQKNAMRDAVQEVNRANAAFEEAAAEHLEPLFASLEITTSSDSTRGNGDTGEGDDSRTMESEEESEIDHELYLAQLYGTFATT